MVTPDFFQTHTKMWLLVSIGISVLAIFLFRPDIVVIIVYGLLVAGILVLGKKEALWRLILASVIALIWMIIARHHYGYNQELLSVAGINLFPLFAWAIGLFGAYLLYVQSEHILKKKTALTKMVLFVALYWTILIVLETLAYHVFHIQNLAVAGYPGLPLCNCIHGPRWLQLSYMLLGPIYFTSSELLKAPKTS